MRPIDDDEELRDDADGEIYASHSRLTEIPWYCAACGEGNDTLLDLQGGYRQKYIEDCSVCCRPNLLDIVVDPSSLSVSLQNELEYDS